MKLGEKSPLRGCEKDGVCQRIPILQGLALWLQLALNP